MKNYRVWRPTERSSSGRRTGFSPKVLPSDKTPLFEELERTLLSGPLENGLVEDSLRAYVDGLADIANLEIVAMHTEVQRDVQLLASTEKEIVHVFGRTRKPHKYFYRRREDGQWSPWEQVELDIQGDHLMPFTFGGRLYLSWAVMQDVERRGSKAQQEAVATDEELPSREELQAQLLQAVLTDPSQVPEIIAQLRELDAPSTAITSMAPTKMELAVKLAVSELRRDAWTAPVFSDDVMLGASPYRTFLTFLVQTAADRVVSTLLYMDSKVGRFVLIPAPRRSRSLDLPMKPTRCSGTPRASTRRTLASCPTLTIPLRRRTWPYRPG